MRTKEACGTISGMPIANVELKKGAHENSISIIRRFTRKIQESGIIQKVKGDRYAKRDLSKLSLKKSALKRLTKRKETERLKKLGKM